MTRERGAALLSVLLLIVVMTTVAVTLVGDVSFAIRRSVNMRLSAQAQWYALGAERLARQVIHQSWQVSPARSTLRSPWARQAARFPTEGGLLEGTIRDGGNCFDINSLVRREDDRWEADDAAAERYGRLLRALQVPEADAERLVDAAIDWMDGDSRARRAGAEDDVYARLTPPYRTGQTPLAEVSELRAVRGYTPELYGYIRPYLCALPKRGRINLNTLVERDAPLLVMLVGDSLSLAEAQDLISTRPASGYADAEQFWRRDAFAGLTIPPEVKALVDVQTYFYQVETQVVHHEAYLGHSALLELDLSGRLTLHRRRFGELE